MRDIRSPRVLNCKESETKTTPIKLVVKQEVTFYDKSLLVFNRIIGLFSNLLAEDRTEIIKPAYHNQAKLEPLNLVIKKKRSVKGLKDKVKSTGTKLKKAASTRHAKVILANSLAILLLGGYTVHATNNHTSSTTSSEDQSTSKVVLRNYLPSSQKSTSPQPVVINDPTLKSEISNITGWITPWNIEATQESLYQAKYISAFWLTLDENGITTHSKSSWDSYDAYLKKKDAKQEIYLTVSGDPDSVYLALSNPTIQSENIKELLRVSKEKQADGIDIDFEGLGSENRDLFTGYIKALSEAFHQEGMKTIVTLECRLANQQPMDWHSLSQSADYLNLMLYDYHPRLTSNPGPISPIGWIKETLDYASKEVNMNKVSIGLGNYGYDWTEPVEGETTWNGVGISTSTAIDNAKKRNITITRSTGIDERGYDIGSTSNYTYQDDDNKQHRVWFEDLQSIQDKIYIIKQYSPASIIFWSIEDSSDTLISKVTN